MLKLRLMYITHMWGGWADIETRIFMKYNLMPMDFILIAIPIIPSSHMKWRKNIMQGVIICTFSTFFFTTISYYCKSFKSLHHISSFNSFLSFCLLKVKASTTRRRSHLMFFFKLKYHSILYIIMQPDVCAIMLRNQHIHLHVSGFVFETYTCMLYKSYVLN